MLELIAIDFVNAVRELRRLTTVLETEPLASSKEVAAGPIIDNLIDSTRKVVGAILQIGARSAWVAADRLLDKLLVPNASITLPELRAALSDIESRFIDELGFNKMFIVNQDRFWMFGSADSLMGDITSSRFVGLWFDCEESAKCLCLGRPTASVFHAMRMLEVGIAALAKRLNIPDPVLANDRNWGNMLGAIKKEIDAKYPPKSRLSGSEGAFLEQVYVSLDAVKNPWRNDTMHVTSIYTDDEARHILSCSVKLIQKMSMGFDEYGEIVSDASLLDNGNEPEETI